MGKDYYKILGVPRDASQEDIKQAYRRGALRHHPDKDKSPGAEELFKEIAEAFDVLSDSDKKAIYDRFGEEGLKGGAPPGSSDGRGRGGHAGFQTYTFQGDPREIFQRMFGGWDPFGGLFGGSRPSRTVYTSEGFPGMTGLEDMEFESKAFGGRQDPPVERDLPLGLQELHDGCTKRLRVTRHVMHPDGTSSMEEKVLCVDVKPGWKAGTKITFPREGDQLPGKVPADIVLKVMEKPHPVFTRQGNDLVCTVRIPLRTALCGGVVQAPTLDGRDYTLQLNDVVTPKTRRRIPGAGMPLSKSPGHKGDLVVLFEIEFPSSLPLSSRQALQQVLPVH